MIAALIAFITFRILDLIDILLVSFLLYQMYRLIKGTVAMNILAGIFLVYLVWLVVKALNMELISTILGQFMAVGVIALIIVFQQEIRRFLLILGTRYRSRHGLFPEWFFSFSGEEEHPVPLSPILEAVENMSKTKTGALIVIARHSELTQIIETGVKIHAEVSARLLETVFFKNTPLHDGAVIIVRDKIVAARCILPTTENIYLPVHFGMRHRAALGMSEKNDSLVILVSEETGHIGYAVGGEIFTSLEIPELRRRLEADLAGNKNHTSTASS